MYQERIARKAKPQKYSVSIVLPCLNEEKTVGKCVKEAKRWLGRKTGEVLVVDNGSTDASIQVARQAGARVIVERKRGYGAAIYAGLRKAKYAFIIIADADLSYDLSNLTPFVNRLAAGDDLVIGNRFAGGIEPDAMPFLHRYIGNPLLTTIANVFFNTSLGDYHSGVRAIRKSKVAELHLHSVGMEFASEMIVRAKLLNFKIGQVPVPYRKDGRGRKSHIRTFRDGWRHLRFLMLFSPTWIFFYPAIILLLTSLFLLSYMIMESVQIGEIAFGVHTMLVLGALLIVGYQLFHWSFCVHAFAQRIDLPVRSPSIIEKLSKKNNELIMGIGGVIFVLGLLFCGWTAWYWLEKDLGNLNPRMTMRIFIPGVVFIILGIQSFFSSLFLSLLNFENLHSTEEQSPSKRYRLKKVVKK